MNTIKLKPKPYFRAQIQTLLWLILTSNIFRSISFYVSLVMSLSIITVCLFWPTTAYEVIIGDEYNLHGGKTMEPKPITDFTLLTGSWGRNSPTDKEKQLSNKLKDIINNTFTCEKESICESYVKYEPSKSKKYSIYQKTFFYAVYQSYDSDSLPMILLRVPFHHTFLLKNLVNNLLPFKVFLEDYFMKVLNSSNLKNLKLKLGIYGISKMNIGIDKQKSNPLTQFSTGVVGAHEYLGLTCIIIHMSSSMVFDKEMGMRSLMSIMGMRRIPYIISYTIIYSVVVFIFSGYGTIIIIIEPKLISSSLQTLYTYFLIFINYFAIGLLILSQSFLMHTITKSVRIITFVVLLAQCLQMIIGMTVLKFYLEESLDPNKSPLNIDWANFIFPVIAFLDAQIEICTGSSVTGFEMGPIPKIIFVFLMAIFTYFIGLYLDLVIDTGTGHSFPWYFPMRSLNNCMKKKTKTYDVNNQNVFDIDANFIEPVNQSIVKVRLFEVQKVFKSYDCCQYKEFRAVQNVTLDLQEGMITAILGHNGAGKTTTFQIIVGLLHATGGSVNIYGLNPSDPWDKENLNQMTSICMQSDILFPKLTCLEHMSVFGVLKGLTRTEILKEINALFQKLDLVSEKDKKASILSGGQMRKLCVAIALLGNPKIVLFDEPTSGVDPISRRCIWNALKDYKKDRVLILSTHYMDEADILADWKAIMVKGKIVCYGTSMFLKKKFNLGYVFSCSLSSDKTNISELFQLIKTRAPSSEFKKRYGMEVTFKIENEEIVELCKYMSSDEVAEKLKIIGIVDYGISVTKLEEIFLKLGEVEIDDENSDEFENLLAVDKSVSVKEKPKEKVFDEELMLIKTTKKSRELSNFIIGFYQFWTFIRLNILLSLRSPAFAILRTVGPVATIAIAALLFWFETGRAKPFEGTGRILSMVSSPWAPYIFFQIHNQTDKTEFMKDLLCIRKMYGNRFIFTNETDLIRPIKGSTHINITNWNEFNGYQLNFIYLTRFKDGYYNIYWTEVLLFNCLVNRLMGINISEKIKYFLISDTWKIDWIESSHPSFLMTSAFVYMMALSVAFSLMNPVISGDVVRDRMLGNLNQMTLYGLKYLSYWGSHFILHVLHYFMIMCVVIVLMSLSNNYMFCETAYVGIFILIYLLASVDTVLAIYSISVIFTDITSAEISFSFSILVPLFLMSIMIFCPLKILSALHVTFVSIFPFLNPWITMMLIDFRTRIERQFLFDSFDVDYNFPFSWLINYTPVINSIIIHIIHIILLSGFFVGYNTYIFVIKPRLEEMTMIQLMRKRKSDDKFTNSISTTMEGFAVNANEDLMENKSLVENIIGEHIEKQNITAVLGDLTKIYHTVKRLCPREMQATIALSNVNLLVNKGEVFGLLGPSGSGKTTAMNCVANLLKPSYGKVVVYDQISNVFLPSCQASAKSMIGLCPQNNPIWPNLTVKEHLLIYSALRGIPRRQRENHSKSLIKLVHLKQYTNTQAHSLSGGCKRRLSMAISFAGNPDLILLDEPSCGVDPKSRRNLWDTISNAIHNTKKGAIITTQFMEECEALCNRLGILINGRIMCIGSPQELKSKFGRGISVEIKVIPGNNAKETLDIKIQLTQYLLEIFPKLLTVENFGERLTFRIPKSPEINFGKVFEVINNAKMTFQIEDYAVSQPTLEQVYFDFAKYQSKDDLKYDIHLKWK